MLSVADIKRLSELKDRTGRKGQGLFLIEGIRAVKEAFDGGAAIRQVLVRADIDRGRFAEVFALAEKAGAEIDELAANKFHRLSSTETSQGIIAVAAAAEPTAAELHSLLRSKRKAIVLLLDRVSDPGNLGTILRSAAWFGADAVFISERSVDAYNPKVVRSAMAAICRLQVAQNTAITDEIPALKHLGFTVIASSHQAKSSYAEFEYPGKSAVVFGSEATGLSTAVLELCDAQVGIPRVGRMESLNVGVAASIIVSEIVRRRSANRRDSEAGQVV